MTNSLSRRNLLKVASLVLPVKTMKFSAGLLGYDRSDDIGDKKAIPDTFPAHPRELVREVVTVAHFNLQRVRELVDARPALLSASWDWGFGDWETPLGAASHMGNRPIAEYLISQGAPPSLFSAAMLGHLDVVKSLLAAQPGAQHIRGPHSISLLAHARAGGGSARPVFEFLQSLGDTDGISPKPLKSDEAAGLAGIYVFGAGATEQIEVSADVQKLAGNKTFTAMPQLSWTRKGSTPRLLFHLGDHIFNPAGAPSVRIRFTTDDEGVLMSIKDADLVLSARREKPGGA